LRFKVIIILTWIGRLPIKCLEKIVKACCQKGAQERAYPVDPMVARNTVVDDIRTKRADRVDTSTAIINA